MGASSIVVRQPNEKPGGTPGWVSLALSVAFALGAVAEAQSLALAEIRAALREPDAFARTERLAALLPTLGPEGATAFPALLSDTSLEIGTVEATLLARYWATHQPPEAGRWALSRHASRRGAALVEGAVEVWARADPVEAARAVREASARPGPLGEVALAALVRGWSDSGQPGLETHLRELGPGIPRQGAIASLARYTIRRQGAPAAIAFADAVPAEDATFKLDVVRQTASEVALQHPELAARWCEQVCREGDGVRTLVAQRWASREGPAAMAWASQQPAGRDRIWAVKGAFRGWYRTDPEGFDRFIDAHEQQEEIPDWLQPALEVYAAAIAGSDPERGLRLAGRVDDSETRERTQVNVARQWRAREPAAAEAWMAHAELSEDALRRIRAAAPTRRPADASHRKQGAAQ